MTDPAAGGTRCLYLVATTGNPTYGDELIAAQWLRHLAQVAPDADVWVDCHAPGLSQLLLGHLHPRVRFVDTLWQMCWAAPSDDAAETVAFVDDAVTHPGRVPRMDLGQPLLRSADVLHVLGGGYINGIWPRHAGLLAGVVAAARLSGARTGMTGQGLLPVAEGGRDAVRALAAEMDVCDVRDQPSHDLLSGVSGPRLTATGDDVLLGWSAELLDDRDSPDVMVSAQSDLLDAPVERVAELITGVLEAWEVAPEQVGWIEAIPLDDRRVFDVLAERLPGARFYPFVELWEQGLPARAGQRWLSTRFHPHLMAAAAGSWGVAVPVRSGYYDVMHDALLALGTGWATLGLDAAGDPSAVPQAPAKGSGFGRRVDSLSISKRQLADALYAPPA